MRIPAGLQIGGWSKTTAKLHFFVKIGRLAVTSPTDIDEAMKRSES
jgi:hypothetical protein